MGLIYINEYRETMVVSTRFMEGYDNFMMDETMAMSKALELAMECSF